MSSSVVTDSLAITHPSLSLCGVARMCRRFMEEKEVKCVIIGDSGVGKSYVLITYILNMFPNFYFATSIDTLTTTVAHRGTAVKLSLYDTGGNSDFDRLRPMFYKEADVIVICFSIADPASLESVREHWTPEIRYHCALKPIILVGCKLDLRSDQDTIQRLKAKGRTPITHEEGLAISREICAVRYFECSSLSRTGLREIFTGIVGVGLDPPLAFRCPCSLL